MKTASVSSFLKDLLFVPVFLTAFSGCAEQKDESSTYLNTVFEAKGAEEAKEFKVNFTGVEVRAGIEATVKPGAEQKVIIRAPENLISKIEISDKDGKLIIGYKKGVSMELGSRKVTAAVFTNELHSVRVSSGAIVEVEGEYAADNFDLRVSSGGIMKGQFQGRQVSVTAHSSGIFEGKITSGESVIKATSAAIVRLRGKAGKLSAEATSAGQIEGDDFLAEEAALNATSGGAMKLNVSGSADARATSGARIRVIGRSGVKMKKSENSGGSVSLI